MLMTGAARLMGQARSRLIFVAARHDKAASSPTDGTRTEPRYAADGQGLHTRAPFIFSAGRPGQFIFADAIYISMALTYERGRRS